MNLELVAAVDAENPIEGDIRLTVSEITLVDGPDGIRQHTKNRLLFVRAEWFLDLRQGFPYFEDVFKKNPNRRGVRSAFRRTIRQTPGIRAVDELKLTVDNTRVARLSFSAPLDGSDEPLVFRDFILGDF